MRMYDLIEKKKNKKALSAKEIQWMIHQFTKGELPDYQMSAMLMAIYFQGLNEQETLDLTLAMRDSGDCLDLSGITGIKADKHSTGGVGDKISLILSPIIAALGIPMAKMSGRGLGHTGGTIDKLECFPGFTTALGKEQFIQNVNTIKLAIAGQTANLAPADKKLYALRDVTATVDQMSLIASSIMSKKLALDSDVIVLDVKTGSGAFMQQFSDAKALAKMMVSIGTMAGRKTSAVITDMDQPLGNAVGNSLEVIEAINALSGNGPADVMEVVYALGAEILILSGAAKKDDAVEKIKTCITDGLAIQKFSEFIEAQGGDASFVFHTEKFLQAKYKMKATAPKEGFVQKICAKQVGSVCMMLGGGREKKGDVIDPSVGIYLLKKRGAFVQKEETLAYVFANDKLKGEAAVTNIIHSYTIGKDAPEQEQMIKAVIHSA